MGFKKLHQGLQMRVTPLPNTMLIRGMPVPNAQVISGAEQYDFGIISTSIVVTGLKEIVGVDLKTSIVHDKRYHTFDARVRYGFFFFFYWGGGGLKTKPTRGNTRKSLISTQSAPDYIDKIIVIRVGLSVIRSNSGEPQTHVCNNMLFLLLCSAL